MQHTDHAREQAEALHRRILVIDGHCDSIQDAFAGKRHLHESDPSGGHLDFPRARQGGLSTQVFALWPPPATYDLPSRRIFQLLDQLLEEMEAANGQVMLVRDAVDVDLAFSQRKLGVMIGIEGGEPLEGDVALLRAYYRLGVRIMGLVWNHRNALADGAMEWETGGGLTRFGRAVVHDMNRLGMVIDTAHLPPAGLRDVLELSVAPVVFSHGNCRQLFDHPRNLWDDQIRSLAARGGVFGISYVNAFMVPEHFRATVRTVADHVDHVCQVVGNAGHVALGSDWDGTEQVPEGLEDARSLPNLTAELIRRGYAEAELVQILGGNYQRVFRQVLRPAAAMPD